MDFPNVDENSVKCRGQLFVDDVIVSSVSDGSNASARRHSAHDVDLVKADVVEVLSRVVSDLLMPWAEDSRGCGSSGRCSLLASSSLASSVVARESRTLVIVNVPRPLLGRFGNDIFLLSSELF